MANRKETVEIKFMQKLIQRVALSGLSHTDYALVASNLYPGDRLVLQRDPANPYDKWAIKVLSPQGPDEEDYAHVGWIPKGQNEMLARILDSGSEVICGIISHDRQRPLTERLYVANYLTVASEVSDD